MDELNVPLITKAEYRRRKFKGLVAQYFDNSIESVVSFLAREEKIGPKEFEELTKLVAEESEKEKRDDNN